MISRLRTSLEAYTPRRRSWAQQITHIIEMLDNSGSHLHKHNFHQKEKNVLQNSLH